MPHGKVCYLEIPALTAEASADFYRDILADDQKAATASSRLMTLVVSAYMGEGERQNPDEQTRICIMVDDIPTPSRRLTLQAAAC
jgi:hypothetical protein